MAQPTLFDERIRRGIAGIVGNRLGMLETYLTSNHLSLHPSPPPLLNEQVRGAIYQMLGDQTNVLEAFLAANRLMLLQIVPSGPVTPSPPQNIDIYGPDAANFHLLEEFIRGGQSPEPNEPGQGEQFHLETFTGNPQDIQGNAIVPQPLPIVIGQNDQLALRPLPTRVPEGSQTGMTGFGYTWNQPNMEPVFATPEENERYFENRMAFFVDSWTAEMDEVQLAPHIFSFHDWVLRLPDAPIRVAYEQAYRDAAHQLHLQPQFIGPIQRTQQNYQVLGNALTMLENQARTRQLMDLANTTVPRLPPPPTALVPPPTTTARPPPTRRRKRPIQEVSSDDEDEDDDDDQPPTADPNAGRPPPKKRGRKIRTDGPPEEQERRRRNREARQRSRLIARQRAREEQEEQQRREERRIIQEQPVTPAQIPPEQLPAGPGGHLTYGLPDFQDPTPDTQGLGTTWRQAPMNALAEAVQAPIRRVLRRRGNRGQGSQNTSQE